MRERFDAACAELWDVQRRLAEWRRVRGGRGRRLPEALWDAAVVLARRGEAGVVARALRLNPESLSRRLAGSSEFGAGDRRGVRSAFVEVSPTTASGGRCRVEVSAPDGRRVSIEFADATAVDLVALAGGLLGAGR
jgi:hypothetical protein